MTIESDLVLLKAGIHREITSTTALELRMKEYGPQTYADNLVSTLCYIRDFRTSSGSKGAIYLLRCAEKYGIETIEDVIRAVVSLREELRTRLPPDQFDIFFNETQNIR